MIDIHSHVLHGLDDGASTLEESLEMLQIAAACGTTDIVATPHADLQYSFDYDLVQERLAEVRSAAPGIRIHSGCDFHLQHDNVQDALLNPHKYTINGKSYLMVEFSDLIIFNNTEDIFERMAAAGIVPVVTHPERNPLLQQKTERVARWVASGVRIQVTAQSLFGRFGNAAKRSAFELLERGLVHFVASDAHDTQHRPPRLNDAFDFVAQEYSEQRANCLFRLNPAAALTGAPLPEGPAESARTRRKWFRFWF